MRSQRVLLTELNLPELQKLLRQAEVREAGPRRRLEDTAGSALRGWPDQGPDSTGQLDLQAPVSSPLLPLSPRGVMEEPAWASS